MKETAMNITRADAIVRIRKALVAKTGRRWSVDHGVGPKGKWIRVVSPLSEMKQGHMSDEHRAQIAAAFGLSEPIPADGLSISPSARAWHVEQVEKGT